MRESFMKRVVTIASTGLLAFAIAAHAAVDWAQDYKSALARAAKEKKLVMMDLYADWCGPCRMLDKTTFANSDVQAALSNGFVAVKINIEANRENQELASRFGTSAIPHIVFVDPAGKKVSEIIGYYPPDEFRDELRKVTEKAAKK